MPRIRTIKPEFFDDEKLSQVSRDARLLFIGLLIHSDDYGVVKGNPRWLKSKIFPYDDLPLHTFEEWLADLKGLGIVMPFTAKEERYLFIRNFTKHQVIDRPSKARNPEPPEEFLPQPKTNNHLIIAEDSTSPRRMLDDGRGKGIGKGNGKGVHTSVCVADPAAPSGDAVAPRQENSENLGSDKGGVGADPNAVAKPDTLPAEPGQDTQPEEKIAKPPPPPKFGPAAVASLWNELGCRPGVQKLTDARRRKLAARLRERADPEWWRELCLKIKDLQIKGRDFLTFDFVIRDETNIMKVLEGVYDPDFKARQKTAIAAGNQPAGDKLGHYSRLVAGQAPSRSGPARDVAPA